MGRDDQLSDFYNFNFDQDVRWNEWIKSVEVPDANNVVLDRIKAKWYKRNIDTNFDIDWVGGTKPSPATSAKASTFFSNPGTTRQQTSEGTQSRSQSAPSSQSSSSTVVNSYTQSALRGGISEQRKIFGFHLAIIGLALLHVLPIPGWSLRAYRVLLQLSILGHGYKIYLRFGKPRVRPLSALQMYFTSAVPTNDFYHLALSLAFLSQTPITLTLVPILVSAAYGLIAFAGSHLSNTSLWAKYGSRMNALLKDKQTEVLTASCLSEIGVGVLLIINLLSPRRSILLAFAHWNMLKMRYHISESAAQHRQVWYMVSQKTAAIRARLPSPLNSGISYVVRWFLSTT